MKRGLREIVGAELEALPAVLAAWGYLRPVPLAELRLSVCFAYGDDGLFWLLRDGAWQADDEAQFHVCAAPRSRGRIASRDALAAIETIARLLGVRVLYAPARPEWEGMLRRLGWATHEGEHRGPLGAFETVWLRRDFGPWPPIWTREAAALEARIVAEGTASTLAAADEARKDAGHGAGSAATSAYGPGVGTLDQRAPE